MDSSLHKMFDLENDLENEFLGFTCSDIEDEKSHDFVPSGCEEGNSRSSGYCSNNSNSSDESDSEDESAMSIQRKRNQLLSTRKQFLNKLIPDIKPFMNPLPLQATKKSRTPVKKPIHRNNTYRSLYSTRATPIVTRRRSKLGDDFLESGILDENTTLRSKLVVNFKFNKRPQLDNESDEGEEYIPQKRRFNSKKSIPHVIVPVEDVTADMLANVAQFSVGKTYDTTNGTSCHQCRQKTIDTKSCCRSPNCVGVRGQFCGPCLKNRYGESVQEVLLDPNWECPVCRGFCNCSICRNRQGKCATGILIGLAKWNGYTNVKDYLSGISKEQ